MKTYSITTGGIKNTGKAVLYSDILELSYVNSDVIVFTVSDFVHLKDDLDDVINICSMLLSTEGSLISESTIENKSYICPEEVSYDFYLTADDLCSISLVEKNFEKNPKITKIELPLRDLLDIAKVLLLIIKDMGKNIEKYDVVKF